MNNYTMEAKEFSDKTVEKAVKTACDYFKCKKEDLEIEIITRGSTGLFGLGGRKARISARPVNEPVKKTPQDKETLHQEPLKAEAGQEPESAAGKEELEPAEPEKAESEVEPTDVEKKSPERPAQKPKMEEIPPELVEKQLSIACDIANEILEKSGLDGRADIVKQASKPYVNISGDDLSLIIGKEGKTLDALEYLVNLCLKKRETAINYRVMLEAGGYRERRRKNLTSLAERMASKARKTGKPVPLQPMPARERRIIHIALRNFKGIRTHSSGEGGRRKVVITPARNRKRSGRTRG